MRFHNTLDDIWNSRIKTRLLRVLNGTGTGLTGRRLADLVGYSHTHTMTALCDLELQGLVNMERAGNSYVFSINRENEVVSRILAPAFELEPEMINTLADKFYDGLGDSLISVILFGSVARGEETAESDVDLLLVLKNSTDTRKVENKIDEISSEAYRAFGCSVVPIVVTRAEYDRKIKRKQGFWGVIPEEGRHIPGKQERDVVG